MFIKLELPVTLTEEDGCFIAICPVFWVGSQGKTLKEALDNAKEALELYLEDVDVQKEFAETILDYAVSVTLSDEEKPFNPDIIQKTHKNGSDMDSELILDVKIHGDPKTSAPVRA